MSKTNKTDQLISASRKEPIQHLPFFSSTDLDVGSGVAANEEPLSSGSSRLGKLEAARQNRLRGKNTISATQFSSSFKVSSTKTKTTTKLSRSKSNKRLTKYVNKYDTAATTSSKEDQKLGDSHIMDDQPLLRDRMEEIIENSAETVRMRAIHNNMMQQHSEYQNDNNDPTINGRTSAQLQSVTGRTSPSAPLQMISQRSLDGVVGSQYMQMGARKSYHQNMGRADVDFETLS